MQERRMEDRRKPNQWYRKTADRRARAKVDTTKYKAEQRAGALRTQAQLDLLRQAIASPNGLHWSQAHGGTLRALTHRCFMAWDESQNRWIPTDLGRTYESRRRAEGRGLIVT